MDGDAKGGETTEMILCKIFGHKWRWRGRSGMNDDPGPDYHPGYATYECIRCGIACRIEEDGKREMWH